MDKEIANYKRLIEQEKMAIENLQLTISKTLDQIKYHEDQLNWYKEKI